MKKYLAILILLFACNHIKKVDINQSELDSIKIPELPPNYIGKYLSQNFIDSCIKKTTTISANKKAYNPFDTLNYDKVIAFDFDGSEENHTLIIRQFRFYDSQIKNIKPLNQNQVNNITNCLTSSLSYGGNHAACFNPHLGLVFYKNNKAIFQTIICLECNYLESSSLIPASDFHKRKLNDSIVISELGFSKSARKQINELLKQLNFSHRIDNSESNFDK